MSAQSYIKLWTAEPSEHDEVQACLLYTSDAADD